MIYQQDRFWKSRTLRRSPRRQHGFSLLELMITVSIMSILAAATFIGLQPALKQARVSSAYDTTLMTLRTYRQQAIAQRRRYIVTFNAPGTITVQSWAFAQPVSPAPILVQTLNLPVDVQFQTQAGVPTVAVPDGFGGGTTPIDFDQGVGLGSQNYVIFMPDGSAQDNLGNLNSGILYLGRANELASMRSITVFGSTGRIRGWTLTQQAGVWTWVQQ